jgi:hypothetical protein
MFRGMCLALLSPSVTLSGTSLGTLSGRASFDKFAIVCDKGPPKADTLNTYFSTVRDVSRWFDKLRDIAQKKAQPFAADFLI